MRESNARAHRRKRPGGERDHGRQGGDAVDVAYAGRQQPHRRPGHIAACRRRRSSSRRRRRPAPTQSSSPGRSSRRWDSRQVSVYDPGSGNVISTRSIDDTGEPYTTGSAFDSSGNFYVADDTQGDISEFSPTGAPLGQFATGLTNPESLVFDNQGNLYVGQQTTPVHRRVLTVGAAACPTSARWRPSSTATTGSTLSSDQCTFYYTSESTDIMRYNQCTNTQESDFNQVPMTGTRRLRGPHPQER